MKNLLTFILVHLVSHPDEVEVTEQQFDDMSEFLIKVHPEDIGQVIGKRGRIIQAIRSIVKVRAMKEQRRISISLLEE